MSERTAELIAPAAGAESAIPWPTPPLPDTSMVTFRGFGDGRTESFVLPGDASVRIAAARGPFVLRVVRPDGTDAVNPANMRFGGLGLGAIPQGGTYAFDVRSPDGWAITVVFAAPK
jgi:hypothetical protein